MMQGKKECITSGTRKLASVSAAVLLAVWWMLLLSHVQ